MTYMVFPPDITQSQQPLGKATQGSTVYSPSDNGDEGVEAKLAHTLKLKSQGCGLLQVTAHALSDLGIKWVILGHSERRKNNLESSEQVGKKTKTALKHGVKVIACIGETLEERNSGQVRRLLNHVAPALFLASRAGGRTLSRNVCVQ